MVILASLVAWFVLATSPSHGFSAIQRPQHYRSVTTSSRIFSAAVTTPAAPSDSVVILPDADAVGAKIRDILQDAATKAIQERGHFALVIPGGSILKMLVGSGQQQSWTSQTTLAYVNHKCVPMDNESLATHAKAMTLFLSDWTGCNTIVMDGTDKPEEATSYEAKLRALPASVLPVNKEGLPVFDLALIGVGDD